MIKSKNPLIHEQGKRKQGGQTMEESRKRPPEKQEESLHLEDHQHGKQKGKNKPHIVERDGRTAKKKRKKKNRTVRFVNQHLAEKG